jgi:hypothetical protein
MGTRIVHVSDNVEGAVYIGRAVSRRRIPGSPFGSPYKPGKDGTRADVLERYRDYVEQRIAVDPEFAAQVRGLAGRTLACWCRHDGDERTPETACHGDVLAEIADRLAREDVA